MRLGCWNLGEASKDDMISDEKQVSSGGGVAFITLFLILGISISIWMMYAYYNPHTSSGQLLIKVG